jgi:2-phosphosulfolactate phosphatase
VAEQQQYQVRFDWGTAGVTALAAADIVVWVDELPGPGLRVPSTEAALVMVASLATADAVADAILAAQSERGERTSIAVIAAGAQRHDGSARFAVEDLLAAGAVIDALAARGIDHSSPEAAAACASYTGLRRATGHLISASVTAQAEREA